MWAQSAQPSMLSSSDIFSQSAQIHRHVYMYIHNHTIAIYICIYTITLSNDASSINANVIRNTAGTVANHEDQQYSQIIQDMAMGYPLKGEFYEYSVEELGKLYNDIVKQERAFIGTISGMNKTPQVPTLDILLLV